MSASIDAGSARWSSTLRCGVAERQPRRRRRLGEPAAGRVAPRASACASRRGPRSAASSARRAGRASARAATVDVAEADLVALVEHRRAAQREQHQQRGADLARVVAGPARREPRHVVVRAGPRRPRARREQRLDLLDDRRASRRPSNGALMNGKLNARCSSSSRRRRSAPSVVDVVDRRLADQQPRRVVGVGDARASAGSRRAPRAGCRCRRTVWPNICTSSGSSAVAGGLSRSSASLMMRLHTSMRKPATPRSNQNRRMSVELVAHVVVPPVEVGLRRQVVEHVVLAGRVVERPRRAAEAAHPVVRRRAVGLADRPTRTSRGARPSATNATSTNHGCWSLVWFGTKSSSTRMPRSCAAATSASNVGERAQLGLHRAVVGDVVAPVVVRRDRDRAQPDAVDAEPLRDGRGARRCPRRSPKPSPFESANDSG